MRARQTFYYGESINRFRVLLLRYFPTEKKGNTKGSLRERKMVSEGLFLLSYLSKITPKRHFVGLNIVNECTHNWGLYMGSYNIYP